MANVNEANISQSDLENISVVCYYMVWVKMVLIRQHMVGYQELTYHIYDLLSCPNCKRAYVSHYIIGRAKTIFFDGGGRQFFISFHVVHLIHMGKLTLMSQKLQMVVDGKTKQLPLLLS